MIDALSPKTTAAPAQQASLRRAAEELEATFLAEMLKPMGADHESSSFGGGIGEAQFSSFLVEEQAKLMVKAGGIGLAESIFRSLLAAEAPGSDASRH